MRLLKLLILLFLLPCGCRDDSLQVRVSETATNPSYLGNGVEWDPYDEAGSWGCDISEEDWQKLFLRMDFMRPGYVRCMISSPFRYFDGGKYDRQRNEASLLKLLEYCRTRDIEVIYGEFNPPDFSMKGDQKWVEMSVDYLNYLVQEKGMDCIRHFIIFNEPDGYWASPNGDYDFWKSMMQRFHDEMAKYPGLTDKVSLAGPDVVVDYRNPASAFDAPGWVARTAADLDHMVGLYDIHAYPGQHQVRSGAFAEALKSFKVPEGKKLVLGEAGYKYWRPEDAALQAECDRRAATGKLTRGSDSQMLCGEFFYGLDLPLLAMDVMDGGLSGMAVWMLDDSMHSNGDSGRPEDLKVWGFWNILGEEVFGDASLEEPKPAYYSWSLMCRYFPRGCDILETEAPQVDGLRMVAAGKDGHRTFAVVNFSDRQRVLDVQIPLSDGVRFEYVEGSCPVDENGLPKPVSTGLEGSSHRLCVPAQSFVLISDFK